jgi:hypothetical protein
MFLLQNTLKIGTATKNHIDTSYCFDSNDNATDISYSFSIVAVGSSCSVHEFLFTSNYNAVRVLALHNSVVPADWWTIRQ